MLIAALSAWWQLLFLFAFEPMRLGLQGRPAGQLETRLLGLDFYGFTVKETGTWLPQVVYVLLCAVLTYTVLRAAPGARPRLGTVLVLLGATLTAAGAADLLSVTLDLQSRPAVGDYPERIGGEPLSRAVGAAGQFALWAFWQPLLAWSLVWRFRAHRVLRVLGPLEDGVARPPLLRTARERRDAPAAGLIPVVLLSVAGGRLLRHGDVRSSEQTSLTFDPDLLFPYRPPEWLNEWSGVLYPALRLRPLGAETTGGLLATLGICLVLLTVLALALRPPLLGRGARRPAGVFLHGWYVTTLAASVAAWTEAALLRGAASRGGETDFAHAFEAALGDAARFGAMWGWATGAAFLGTVLVLRRRAAGTQQAVNAEESSDAG